MLHGAIHYVLPNAVRLFSMKLEACTCPVLVRSMTWWNSSCGISSLGLLVCSSNSPQFQILRYRGVNRELKILEYCLLPLDSLSDEQHSTRRNLLSQEFSLLLLQAVVSYNSLCKLGSTILKTAILLHPIAPDRTLFCNFAFLVVRKCLI